MLFRSTVIVSKNGWVRSRQGHGIDPAGIADVEAKPAGTGPYVLAERVLGQRVRLTVLDQGPGFADNILKRAFEPYVTTKVRGTGLGLAVVKKIVDEHGARIELSNQEAGGRVVGGQVAVSFAVAN